MRGRWKVKRLLPLILGLGLLIPAVPARAADGFTPSVVNLSLEPGESAVIDKTLHLDALPGKADIVIAIDTTGSMGGPITQAKSEANDIVADVQAQIPGARFAVVDFEDYPGMPGGSLADNPYQLLTPGFTASDVVVEAAIDTMVADNGGDQPEAYNRVFFEAYSDPALVYDPQAVRFLVVLGDARPHDENLGGTFSDCAPNTPPTDFGRDGIGGTLDDLTTLGTLNGLVTNETTLLMVFYNTGFPSATLACYDQLSSFTGGDAVAGGSGSDLSDLIVNLVQDAAAQIDEVDLVVDPASYSSWVSFNPAPPYGPFMAPVDVVFQETITVPPGTPQGTNTFTVRAIVDGTERAVQQVNVEVLPGPPAELTLEPETATNIVDEEHCVTATVVDELGQPTPGITVVFTVTGSVNTSGSAITNDAGQAVFCYTGPALPGSDTITAFADTNGNGTQDPGEPGDTASKEWVAPPTTPDCKVTYGGSILAANADKATFGGNAQVTKELKGQEEYQDHGPAESMNVHSLTVDALSCSDDGTMASIFGQASIDGVGNFGYRIDLEDLGEPGTSDSYRIRLSTGYDSGMQTLDGGNVQIHL
jgi:hypothetical protein